MPHQRYRVPNVQGVEAVSFRLQLDDFVRLGLVYLTLQAVAILQIEILALSLRNLVHLSLSVEQFGHVKVNRVHLEKAARKLLLINGLLLSEERVIEALVVLGHSSFLLLI